METKIKWAKRIDPSLIRRLYASDAKNIQDIELVDEVGYGLYARAESILKVTRAHIQSVIDCPVCNGGIYLKDEMFACQCGWNITQKSYNDSYRKKQLVAIFAIPAVKKFISDWEKAKDSYSDKMRAIDCLIHSFHRELNENEAPARPIVVNFVDCKLLSAIELIFELAYGYDETVYNEQFNRWLANAKKSYLKDSIAEIELAFKRGL
jgi:hypothetical protein